MVLLKGKGKSWTIMEENEFTFQYGSIKGL